MLAPADLRAKQKTSPTRYAAEISIEKLPGHPNAQYGYVPSPTYSGSSATARRGPLPFAPAPQYGNAEAEMEDIINTGSTTAASCPGFGAQAEDTGDMDNAEIGRAHV